MGRQPTIQGRNNDRRSTRVEPVFRRPYLFALAYGLTIGWLAAAMLRAFTPALLAAHAPRQTNLIIIVAILAALAIGPLLPRRFAAWLAGVLWFWRRRHHPDPSQSPIVHQQAWGHSPPRDRRLMWMVFATATMSAGLLVALLPASFTAGNWLFHRAYDQFLWMPATLAILTLLVVLLTALPAWSMIGLGLTCLHHLDRTDGRWSQSVTPWALLGVALGTTASTAIPINAFHPNLLILLASLPLFAVAIDAARRSNRMASPRADNSSIPETAVPTNIGSLLEAVIVCATLSLTGSMIAIFLVSSQGGTNAQWSPLGLSAMVVATAVGFMVPPSNRNNGLGLKCAIAGLLSIAACASTEPMGLTFGRWVLPDMLALGAIVALAHTISQAMRIRTDAAVEPGKVGAAWLSITACIPAALLFCHTVLGSTTSQIRWIVGAAALALVALGAWLVLRDPALTSAKRRTRLAAIACLAIVVSAAQRRTDTVQHDDPPRLAQHTTHTELVK